MVSQDLLDILRCPSCVREKEGLLDLYKDTWLICQDCGRKYPIVEDIPVMLTGLQTFEIAGRLYEIGIRGNTK